MVYIKLKNTKFYIGGGSSEDIHLVPDVDQASIFGSNDLATKFLDRTDLSMSMDFEIVDVDVEVVPMKMRDFLVYWTISGTVDVKGVDADAVRENLSIPKVAMLALAEQAIDNGWFEIGAINDVTVVDKEGESSGESKDISI